MEKGAIDLLMIVLEQELVECEKRKVVKSRKEYNHKYYLEKDEKEKNCTEKYTDKFTERRRIRDKGAIK